MDGSKRYKAFISYAHKDEAWAKRLLRKLENFRLPNQTDKSWPLRPVFLDRSELASSPDLSDSILNSLKDSSALIVICSPAAAASKWVNAEILLFKRLGNKAIYPIVIDGEPGSEILGENCFPEALRYQLDANGDLSTTPAEPLAADARKSGDGGDAVLKLVAGLLGVTFDTLKLRQQRRRVKQALTLAAGAIAMVVLTSYLAIAALVSQQDAERRRDQAEGLISFMLGDLRKRLQPVGRLDVLDGVGEQALEYFSSLTETELSGDAMLTRATALRQIGEVRVAQGLIDEGLVAFSEALALLNNSKTESEAIRLFELGQINYWIADAYFKDLQLNEAHSYIEKYLGISRELVQLEPGNPDYQLELLYAESNLGTLALRANKLDTAREYFNNALKIGKTLATNNPSENNDEELAITLSWLGAVEAAAGNFVISLDWYQQQLAIRRALMAASDDPHRKHVVGRALHLLAGIQEQAGQVSSASQALDESVQLYRDLVAYDPQNYEWQREFAWSLASLASYSYATGESTAESSRATLSLAREAISRVSDDDTAETTRVIAAIELDLARVELIEGYPAKALDLSQNATRRLASLISGDDRIRLLPLYAKASYISAEALLTLGNTFESKTTAETALQNLSLREDDPIEVRAYAAVLSFLAKDRDAETLMATVAETDYRGLTYIPNTETEAWWSQRID
jgi:tetratricopeptide (TPR) repeat protein